MATKVVEVFDNDDTELYVRELKFGDKLIVLRYEGGCFRFGHDLRVVEVERLTEFPRPSIQVGGQEILCYYRAKYIDRIEPQEPYTFALNWWSV